MNIRLSDFKKYGCVKCGCDEVVCKHLKIICDRSTGKVYSSIVDSDFGSDV